MFGFTKAKRLLKKTEYTSVFQQAKKLATKEFIFLSRPNSLGYARLGLAISKKNIAKAKDRNRIKRAVRESFRKQKLPSIDVVVLAKSGIANIDRLALNSVLEKAWDRLSTFCEP